jgi:hypothetical protein
MNMVRRLLEVESVAHIVNPRPPIARTRPDYFAGSAGVAPEVKPGYADYRKAAFFLFT